jgi:hypothetical protein
MYDPNGSVPWSSDRSVSAIGAGPGMTGPGLGWVTLDSRNRPPGETNRPYPCRACNGAGGQWKQKKYVDSKGKAHSESFFEVCKSCGGSGRNR